MLMVTLVGSKLRKRKHILDNPDALGELIGPFQVRHVVDHDPQPGRASEVKRWAFNGEQMIQVTIESAREDYGVVVPSYRIKVAVELRQARSNRR